MIQRRPSRRRIARRIAGAVACALMLSAAAMSPLHASTSPLHTTATSPSHPTATVDRTRNVYHPRPGLTLTTVHYKGPTEVRVLKFAPKPGDTGMTVSQSPSGPVISSHATPSSIAANIGAIAAVNGDFAHQGEPAHFNAIDGDVRTSGIMTGSGFAITQDEKFAWAQHPDISMTATSSNATSFVINHWNGDDQDGPGGPVGDEINAYTKAGGIKQAPDGDTCAIRLINPTMRRWADDAKTALTRTWDVGQKVCQHDALSLGSDPGNVVLNSRQTGLGADALNALPSNGTVTISWGLTGWPGIIEAVGGQPMIVRAGVNVGPPQSTGSSYFFKPNPRTAIGITKACADNDITTQCHVIYMVVDGRDPSWSLGMTLKREGEEMLKYGAWYAINIDGGGGSSMWLKDKGPWCITDTNGGCLVSRPSDGTERATLTAMMVLQGPDPNEPPIGDPARISAWTYPLGLPDDTSQNWDLLSLTDPGSTGGLLDALAEAGRLPAGLRPSLRVYRRAVS
jgi:hypothetical protein